MLRILAYLFASVFLLAACAAPTAPTLGSDGKPLPQARKILPRNAGKIQFRVLDSINVLRQAAGVGQLQLNSQLNAAAATHSRDMSLQNRPWHFGSDGSSPIERVQRTGYTGRMLGENISESYETELETLSAWMDLVDTRAVILDSEAVNLGFSWYQEANGKTWWTMITGG